ncbi:proteasome assembly chaperone (PAC2) family protein [Kribbella orskensis]|uniref:Proteasome assembly chaperone (PAC2) family protein n=1 Tax=Kribbella orskensis TaxID=2512216 RepID=A0ABY2BGY1_9ACTN|nr:MULTISPECIES: PAC2 family protein [Kribbella]TCN38089.1 proteasome assembly chaperone (PAC2) family protein [Kribbella sp. VKM Ac-2500]TCO19576.1 proteasome assembly chaperone (PAC2) family protein [Kribbella orskensis]
MVDLANLRDPVVIAAFEGWNDAAEAATGAVDHLIEEWDAELVTAIDPEDYYDFQVNRPQVNFDDEGIRRLTWPTTRVFLARPEDTDRDVLLIRGIEPNMRWRGFCRELLELVDESNAQLVVVLGALLADSPHTRPIPVTASSSDPELTASWSLEPSTYEGPTGITGVFADLCSTLGVPSVSIWAAIPHYIAGTPCPKASLALLGKVEALLDLPIPEGDLPEMARAWQRGADELSEEDPEVAEYVASLEEQRDTTDLPEASGDAIAAEFERYLRRRNTDRPD